MAFQTANLAGDAYLALRNNAPSWKAQAQQMLTYLQNNSVDTNWVFRLLDNLNSLISSVNTWTAVAGLNAYATSMGYSGTMSTDAAAIATAAQGCIGWVTSNFPASGGFLQGYTLNADGTRTARSFTTAQTAGLQTTLSTLIGTIS